MNIYQRINGADWRNIWVVGDLHGCYSLLMAELSRVGFDAEKDLLISVGDLVDRGRENIECLELITLPWFRAVRGNHEQMMIDAVLYNGSVLHWMSNGGDWFYYLDSDKQHFARNLVAISDRLPLVIELITGSEKIVICHADYPDNEYQLNKLIDPQQAIWNRERVSDSIDGKTTEITGADQFFFGHTPARQPLKYANQTYIDTGAVFCGNLTLVQVQGGDHD